MTQENKLSESQEWTLREMSRLRREIARVNAINASYSLDRLELAEHLAEAGREHLCTGNVYLSNKYKKVVKRITG